MTATQRSQTLRADRSPFHIPWLPADLRAIIPTPLMAVVVLTVILVPLDFQSVGQLATADGLSNRGWGLRVLMAGGPLLFLLNDPGRAFERLVRYPVIGFTMALVWSVATIPLSISRPLSFVATVSFSCTLLWLVTAVDRAGWEAFERATAFGLLVFVSAATVTDVLGIGVAENPGIASINFDRLKGIALHPNTLGAASAVLVLMSLATISRKRAVPWLGILGLPVGVMALLWTQSRTALAGLIIAVAVAIVPRSLRSLLIFSAFSILVFIAAFGGFEGQTWRDLSRAPADATEVSGLSGRPDLWRETIDIIGQRPIHGFGLGAASEAYEETGVASRTGWDPPDAHNTYLQSSLTIGLVGLGLVSLSLVGYWSAARHRPDRWRDAAVVLVLAGSLTESVLLAFLPSLTFVVMVAALASVSNPVDK